MQDAQLFVLPGLSDPIQTGQRARVRPLGPEQQVQRTNEVERRDLFLVPLSRERKHRVRHFVNHVVQTANDRLKHQ